MDPLEEQMQRLSVGKKVPPNIVTGKYGMKELISYMTVNTKPKQVGILIFSLIDVVSCFLFAFRHPDFISDFDSRILLDISMTILKCK